MLRLFVLIVLAGLGAAGCMSARKNVGSMLLAFLLGVPVFLGSVSLILADIGWYEFSSVLLFSVLWGVFGIWRLRRLLITKRESALWVATLIIAVLSAVLFSRPHTYLHGGWDPGEYISTSASIARTGGIRYVDPFVSTLPDELLPTFCRNPTPPRPTLHAGYLMLDKASGKMVPDYFHFYPAWLSMFHWSGGTEGGYLGQTCIAVLAMVVVLLYVHQTAGLAIALLATIGLMLNPAILYFGRFPSTEIMSMLLLFGCMFLLHERQRCKSSGGLFLLAVVAFALTTSHIINLVPMFAMVLTCIAYGVCLRDKDSASDAMALCVGGAIGAIRNAWVTPLFMETLFRYYVVEQPGYILGSSLLFAGSVAGFWFAWKYLRPRLPDWLRHRFVWRNVPGLLVLAFGCYHYFVRPRFESGHDVWNLRSIAWLFSPVGVFGAFLAFFLPLRKKLTRSDAVLLVAGGLTTVILLQSKYIQPYYMWAYRRYVPLVIPLFAILLAYTIDNTAGLLRRFRLQFLPYAAFVALIGWQVYQARALIRLQEHAGLPAHVARVADALQDADFVLIDHWKLATPLRIAHGLPVYQLSTEPESIDAERQGVLYALIMDMLHAGQTVYYVTHTRPFYLPGWHPRRIADLAHSAATLRWHRGGIPKTVQVDDSSVTIYEFVAGQDATFTEVEFDVGYHSIGLVAGFYEMRRRPDRTMRWTNGNGSLYIPGLSQGGEVTLSLTHGRPGSFPSALELKLYLDGTAWETLLVEPGWREYTLTLPPSMQAVQTLSLKCATWDPALYGITGYAADLGVGVSGIRISATGPGELADDLVNVVD